MDKVELPEHHLYYELSMLLGTSRILVSDYFQLTASPTLKNAVLESFLVHLRSLKDFLWDKDKKRKNDDIVADHFGQNCSRRNTKCQDKLGGKSIDEIDTAINKQISHLTESRTNSLQGKNQWQIREIACDLAQYFDEFLKNVEVEKMNEEYASGLQKLVSDFKSDCLHSTLHSSASTVTASTTVNINASIFFMGGPT